MLDGVFHVPPASLRSSFPQGPERSGKGGVGGLPPNSPLLSAEDAAVQNQEEEGRMKEQRGRGSDNEADRGSKAEAERQG